MAALTPAAAESLSEALAAAYNNNPTLNAQRAALRATDEGVPQAKAGYRPTVSASADAGIQVSNASTTYPRGVSLTVEQPIFLGFRTKNSVKMAETAVLAGREVLRSTEATTLLSAVTAFMNLVKAQADLNLQSQNVGFLRRQLSAENDRLRVGEGTRTDVAQTNARLAAAESQYSAAVATLNAAIATYEQIIGHRPKSLGAATPIDRMLPSTLDAALAEGNARNPTLLASGYNVDVAVFNVNVLEGALLPSVTVNGTLSNRSDQSGSGSSSNSASLVGRLSVPIYNGGLNDSKVRQAKETLGQRRLERDAAMAQVRQSVISGWGSLDAARAQARAADAQVAAQNLVLSGVIEQQKVGQSTTLDVLDAQQDLLNAKLAQVTAQRDRIVAGYTLLSAIGALDGERLALKVQRYDETDHYNQVRDKWHGLRTPDGR